MSTKQLLLGTSGICAAYLTLSLINERLFTHEYAHLTNRLDGEVQTDKFKFPDLCVCLSSLMCALFSYLRSKWQKDKPNPIPRKQYLILGFFYCVNVLASFYALLYISYPVRVVSDKCGYMTAVIVGVYFSRIKKSNVKLEPRKVIIAVIITVGAAIFALYRQDTASKTWDMVYDPDKMWIGYLLMFISISGEAFFTDSQAYCKISYKPTINHLMFTVNVMTSIFCLSLMIAKQSLLPAIEFCMTHPFASIDILLISSLQVLGQISIYFVVMNFKQHIFPLVSLIRKILTVLLSIYWFNHKMNIFQWGALVLVFGGLGYELFDELYADIFKTKKVVHIKKKPDSDDEDDVESDVEEMELTEEERKKREQESLDRKIRFQAEYRVETGKQEKEKKAAKPKDN